MNGTQANISDFGGKVIALYAFIERETEKAVLVSANGSAWLPKSQVEFYVSDHGVKIVAMPGWLWKKHPMVLCSKVKNREAFMEMVERGEIKRA